MNLDDQNLEWKLCEAYFSILEKNTSLQVSFEELVKMMVDADLKSAKVEKISIEQGLLSPTWENPI